MNINIPANTIEGPEGVENWYEQKIPIKIEKSPITIDAIHIEIGE